MAMVQTASLSQSELPATGGGGMDDHSFYWWSKKLEERAGIVIPASRKQFLASNLNQRIRATRCQNEEEYYSKVLEGPLGAREWAQLIDCLTVHQTHFFRHLPSVELVRQEARRWFAQGQGSKRELHAWSVGCSTGEEAWTLGMILAEEASPYQRAYYSVLGTDVSQPALNMARLARYDLDRLREIPAEMRERWCLRDDMGFSIHPELRKRVAFATLNLLDRTATPLLSNVHLIYCQNVLIYMPRRTRHQILNRFATLLSPGGVLLLGPGEVMTWEHEALEPIDHPRTLAFRRRARGNQA